MRESDTWTTFVGESGGSFFKFRTLSETKLNLVDQYEIYFKYMDQPSISRRGRHEGGV